MRRSANWLRSPEAISLLLTMMVLYSLLSLGRAVTKFIGPEGGLDFHSYWYSGHFIRQGVDPYRAFFDHLEPQLPVSYLDEGVVDEGPVARPGLARTPANTAPMVLLLSVFSLFSWPTAKLLWFLVTLASALIVPWLVLPLTPAGQVTTPQKSFVVLSFYMFSGTRVATWMGQTSLFVLLLMLVAAVTWRRGWFWPGILLGLALSKYSLAIPVLLLALYQRKVRVLVTAVIVQIAGVVALAFIDGASLISIAGEYLRMARYHASLQGAGCYQCIHVGSLFSERPALVDRIIAAAAILVLAMFWLWLRRRPREQDSDRGALASILVFAVFTLWSLLAGYHRSYDVEAAVIFVAASVAVLSASEHMRWSSLQRTWLVCFLAAFVAVLILPGEIMGVLLPDRSLDPWLRFTSVATTAALAAALVVSWLLLVRLRPKSTLVARS